MQDKTYYGLFYKSAGRWVGPYGGTIYTEKQRRTYVKNGYLLSHKATLKSQVKFQKLRVVLQ